MTGTSVIAYSGALKTDSTLRTGDELQVANAGIEKQ